MPGFGGGVKGDVKFQVDGKSKPDHVESRTWALYSLFACAFNDWKL